mmetsp:Transcript_34409/g.80325  ORF Transcript_34409/g.80325 Transcript_34409/m.80325 type:complete len:170 (+) Transcript_34409:74-583(+)
MGCGSSVATGASMPRRSRSQVKPVDFVDLRGPAVSPAWPSSMGKMNDTERLHIEEDASHTSGCKGRIGKAPAEIQEESTEQRAGDDDDRGMYDVKAMSSWDSGWGQDAPPDVPQMPDRKTHELHVRQVKHFLQHVKKAPRTLVKEVRYRRAQDWKVKAAAKIEQERAGG